MNLRRDHTTIRQSTMATLYYTILLLAGLSLCDDQVVQVVEDTAGPYYSEDSQYYPDYGFQQHQPFPQDSSSLDRQGIEAVLATPVVLTAFVAAIVGGILSPLITEGLTRLGEYEIEWPEVKRRVPSTESSDDDEEERSLESWSWIQALETVSQALEESRTKRSSVRFDKYLSR